MNKKMNRVILILLSILGLIGLVQLLIYIFYSSTGILTSDSVITDVLSHQQRINNSLFLKNWYYGNEFWIFSLSILTYWLSFFIDNSLLVRQIGVFITACLLFILLFKYSKKVFNFKQKLILITIFLSGISYSVLDYFYAFNAYLTVVINSLFIIYLFYIIFVEEKKSKLLYVIFFVFVILINMGSLRYFPSVIFPLILTELTLIIIPNKSKKFKTILLSNKKKILGVTMVLVAAVLGLGIFIILTNVYHYEQRAGTMTLSILNGEIIVKKITAIIECIVNFFGFDNRNNPVTFMTGAQYFVKNHVEHSIFSIMSFTIIIKFVMCIFVMIISPIVLLKKYKDNNKFINFLLIFNLYSWFCMIYMYLFTNNFFYNYSELKYFLLNMILNLFMGIYVLYNYVINKKIKLIFIDIFMLLYISSNLYTTYLTIKSNNKESIDKKYELINVLEENDLTFGYGDFWSGLLFHFLSNYEITIASLEFRYNVLTNYKWYSDESWYHIDNDKPVFLIVNKKNLSTFKKYDLDYLKPDRIIECNGFWIYIYNKDPFIDNLE